MSAYIGFMACNVKKQIRRSTMLTDSLLKTAHSNINKQAIRSNAAGVTADSLNAHADWKELWIDSLLRETPDRNTIGIYGVHWAARRQKLTAVSASASARKTAENRSRTSTDSITLHNRTQASALGKHIEKSPGTKWWLLFAVPVIILAAACFLYKKIRNVLKL